MQENTSNEGAGGLKGKVNSGAARMAMLSPEERSAMGKQAAERKWKNRRLAVHAFMEGHIPIAGVPAIHCVILADGTRWITESGFLTAIGRTGRNFIAPDEGDVAPFLAAANLSKFITDDVRDYSMPKGVILKNNTWARCYRAELVPLACEVFLKARQYGSLTAQQLAIAQVCEIIVRGLSHVGIAALIDEATGFQDLRAKDALATILEDFVAKELQPYVKAFPNDFYKELCRVRQISYDSSSVKRPQYFGSLTNDIVYARLAPGVLEELQRVIPRNAEGRPKAKFHQHLTKNLGFQKLLEHMSAVVVLLKVSPDYNRFMFYLDTALPRKSGQMALELQLPDDNGVGL